MFKDNFVKKSVITLTLVFFSVAVPKSIADNNITGVWENEEVGTIDIKPCEDNKDKLCGYLLKVKADISKKFNLHVYKDMERNLIITGLEAKDDNGTLQGGKFKNIDGFLANNSTVTVSYDVDKDKAKVEAGILFFSKGFKFNRVKPNNSTPKI